MNATEQLARFIAKTRYEDIPRPVLDATRTINNKHLKLLSEW